MAKIKICDRCGLEIKKGKINWFYGKTGEIALETYLEIYGRMSRQYDLCPGCFQKLQKFLKRENEADESN